MNAINLDFGQKALQLFDEKDLKNMIHTRKEFEDKLVMQNRSIIHYVDYIKSERNLMARFEERQRARESELQLQHSIAQNIKRIYELAVARYPQRQRLWEQYILFCTQHTYCDEDEMRDRYARWRRHHAEKPSVWLEAIRWERNRIGPTGGGIFNHNPRDTEARSLLRQAMLQHPDCTELSVELLNMELSGDGGIEDTEVRLQHALTAYRSCSASNQRLEFHVAMLAEASQHTFTARLQTVILQKMRDKAYHVEPLYWHTIAMRALNGLSTIEETEMPASVSTSDADKTVAMTTRRKIEGCARVYEMVIDVLPRAEMWTYYLDTMLALNSDRTAILQPLRHRMLRQAFKRADADNRMTAEHYKRYVELLNECKADVTVLEDVLQRAVQRFGRSVPLWIVYMRMRFRTGDESSVHSLFEQACKKLASKSQPVWDLYINFLRVREANTDRLRTVYEQVSKQMCPSFAILKVDYMDWVFRNPEPLNEAATSPAKAGVSDCSIEGVRTVFRRVVIGKTVCIEMVQKMAELESQQFRPNVVYWRNALETGTKLFGQNRTDVWLNRMKFEQLHGKPWLLSQLGKEAMEQLKSAELRNKFERERNLWQNEIL